MALFKSATSRRREVRKTLARRRPLVRASLSRAQVVWGLALAGLFVVIASWIVLTARSIPRYVPGQLVDRHVLAQVEFTSVDPDRTERMREERRRLTPSIYNPTDVFFTEMQRRLIDLPEVAATVATPDEVAAEYRHMFGVANEQALYHLSKHQVDGQASERWTEMVKRFVHHMRRVALISPSRVTAEQYNQSDLLHLQVSESEKAYVETWYNATDSKKVIEAANAAMALAEQEVGDFPRVLEQAIQMYVVKSAVPTYEFDASATARAKEQAAAAVEALPQDYPVNENLVTVGRALDASGYRILKEHDAALSASDGPVRLLGPIVLVVVITAGLIVTVISLRPRIAENPMRGLALTALLLATLVLVAALRPAHPYALAAAAIGPAMLAAVILAIAYDQRFAMGIAALTTILIALELKLSVGLMLATLSACAMAVVQLRELRQRGVLIRIGVTTALVAAFAVMGASLTERALVPTHTEAIKAMAAEASLAALACVVVGFFVLGILPFIEKAFKVTTSMTLLELCDVNQQLLRQLAQKAPGTYNHSLQVGTLAEAAAESIGANGLLARVGAYYHDIGKMHKPQYFVENQAGGQNLHDKLSPAMSLLIIVGHVKDGVEMAREYGLPPQLVHFIESHHGTTLVEYFYHAAKMQKGDDAPAEIEFRYPGPKPQTKETAILMICDAVESACRTMSEPTAVRIEQLVDKIAMKRLMDGQFDHCDLTLAELEAITDSVAKALCAIYHGRISYPSDKERDKDKPEPRKGAAG